VDKQGKDWGNEDMPSNGKIAWLLWGGDEGWKWTNKLLKQLADFEETSDFGLTVSKDPSGYWRDPQGQFADPPGLGKDPNSAVKWGDRAKAQSGEKPASQPAPPPSPAPAPKRIPKLSGRAKPAVDRPTDDAATVQASSIPKMEKDSTIKTLAKLDLKNPADKAYRQALLDSLTDRGGDNGNESSLDRARELYRLRGRKSLSDDDATEAGDFLRQGLRGTGGSSINQANLLLGQEIYGRLSDSQKTAFAQAVKPNNAVIKDDPALKDNDFIQDLRRRSEAQ
jgi:hypothetical protein